MYRSIMQTVKRLISCFVLANIYSAGTIMFVPRSLLAHTIREEAHKSTTVQHEFDQEVYGHTLPTVESQRAHYQLRELFGLGTGKQFSGFAFPDTTSNWDAESIDVLYNEVLNRQFLEDPMQTSDIDSPFNSSIGN